MLSLALLSVTQNFLFFVPGYFANPERTTSLVERFSNAFSQNYKSLALYLVFTFALSSILSSISYLASLSRTQDGQKKSEYECGFEPFDSATRLPFEVHFYLVGILFLIFDVEVALLFP